MTRHEAAQRFILAVWRAADASRAYRTRAEAWRAAGSVDYAAQLEAAADAHDAEWDARLRAQRETR